MKQYKVGDEIKVYEILNNGNFAEDHTGKQVAALEDFGNLITVPLRSTHSRDAEAYENLKYWIDNGDIHSCEAKHVCTMRITKLKSDGK